MDRPLIRVLFFDLGDTLVVPAARSWVPGASQTLAELRDRHMRLGVISNTGTLTRAELAPHLPPDFDWAAFADDLVLLSAEVKVEKPDREIFRLAVDRAGTAAAACLFCTESLADSIAAQGAGMRTARVQPPPHSDIGDLIRALVAAGAVE
jgi:FMN phosphatase YigB (HAD superfamily)